MVGRSFGAFAGSSAFSNLGYSARSAPDPKDQPMRGVPADRRDRSQESSSLKPSSRRLTIGRSCLANNRRALDVSVCQR